MGFDKKVVKRALSMPSHFASIAAIKGKIYDKVASLEAEVIRSDEPIPYAELDTSLFRPIAHFAKWADKFGCAWFRFKGEVPAKAAGKRVVVRLKLQGEGLVYDARGNVIQGVTQVLSKGDIFHALIGKQAIDVSGNAVGGEKIEYLVDAGFNGKLRFENLVARLRRCDVCTLDTETYALYYDCAELYFLLLKLDKSDPRFAEIDGALKQCYKKFSSHGASAARSVLAPVLETPNDAPVTTYYSVGHAHIDLAWLWPIRETKRKTARTFANQLKNIAAYDDYRFSESQPQMFEWLKEDYPALFQRVKDAVNDGHIELQGAMWCESDCNLVGGESLIRQSLYGRRFWKEEFGLEEMPLCWLPDVFGFPASLPQILKKCGMDWFMTIKLLSNTVNSFPYKSFIWRGIDGSELTAHMEPLGDYNSGGTPMALFKSEKRNTEKDLVDKALLIYGDGDGGGGPGEGHIEFIKRQADIKGLPKCKFSPAKNFFRELEQERGKLPLYDGELYYERHQGCYTSQSESKRLNRLSERLLHEYESLSATSGLSTEDKSFIDDAWREILLYQFHDILPGSSIKRVYDETHARYKIIDDALDKHVLALLRLKCGKGENVLVYNASDFKRRDYFKRGERWYEANTLPYSCAEAKLICRDVDGLNANDDVVENAFIKVTFGKGGEIISVVDKRVDKELVREYFNRLVVFSDPFSYYNAWDIVADYRSLKFQSMKLVSRKAYRDGPRAVIEQSFTYDKSKLVQKIYLESDDATIYFDTVVDWREELKMLRAEFVPAIFADEVACGIQFGNVRRSTREDNSLQKAQFEVCAHKYVNLDGDDYGIALFNDCKYGHRVKSGLLSLALLRSPNFPDPTCDRGEHHIRYAVYPHQGTLESGDVVARAEIYNSPLRVFEGGAAFESDIRLSGDVVTETIKPAENVRGAVVRAYECYGKAAAAALTCPYARIYECDMLENPLAALDSSSLSFSPFEIKTLLLTDENIDVG